jgi:hypothetical protein
MKDKRKVGPTRPDAEPTPRPKRRQRCIKHFTVRHIVVQSGLTPEEDTVREQQLVELAARIWGRTCQKKAQEAEARKSQANTSEGDGGATPAR